MTKTRHAFRIYGFSLHYEGEILNETPRFFKLRRSNGEYRKDKRGLITLETNDPCGVCEAYNASTRKSRVKIDELRAELDVVHRAARNAALEAAGFEVNE